MIAAELVHLQHGGDRRSDQAAKLPLETQSEAAEQMQVSRSSIQAARKIQETAPGR